MGKYPRVYRGKQDGTLYRVKDKDGYTLSGKFDNDHSYFKDKNLGIFDSFHASPVPGSQIAFLSKEDAIKFLIEHERRHWDKEFKDNDEAKKYIEENYKIYKSPDQWKSIKVNKSDDIGIYMPFWPIKHSLEKYTPYQLEAVNIAANLEIDEELEETANDGLDD